MNAHFPVYIQIIYFDSKISCIFIQTILNSVQHYSVIGDGISSIPEILEFSAHDTFLGKPSSGDAQNNLHQVPSKSKDLKAE
jgi:hypothetical protein